MIKVTIYDLLSANPVLHTLRGKSMVGPGAFAVARLIREVQKELETYDQSRMEIIEQYAEKDENGQMKVVEGNAQIKPNKLEECKLKIHECASQEVELNVSPLIPEWFNEINLTADEAMVLEPLMNLD